MSGPAPAHPLHRGTTTFKQHGVAVTFDVLEGVFAGAGVDAGTRHLLRWLAADRYRGARSVLDVGCGYGPLGLWLGAADAHRRVVAVDRDARAIDACRLGAARNGLAARVEVLGSLGYDALPAGARFDLVVSNIPAKVGGGALGHLLLDACHVLTDDGIVAVVVVDRLAATVDALLADPAVEVLDRRPSPAYTAFEYRFGGVPAGASPDPGFDRGVYRRGRERFSAGGLSWEADVAHSIAEFDTLAHGTQAAVQLLEAQPTTSGPVVVCEVGQGHLALALRALGHDGTIRLVDRDLLALRTAAANLQGAVEIHHVSVPTAEVLTGCAVAVIGLPEKEPVATTATVLAPLLRAATATPVVLWGRTADVSRVRELLARHGARREVAASAKVGRHSAVLVRVRGAAGASPATPHR